MRKPSSSTVISTVCIAVMILVAGLWIKLAVDGFKAKIQTEIKQHAVCPCPAQERWADLPIAFRDISMNEHFRVDVVHGRLALFVPLIPGGREGESFWVDGFENVPLEAGMFCFGQLCELPLTNPKGKDKARLDDPFEGRLGDH